MALTPLQRRRVAWLIDGHLDEDADPDSSAWQTRWERQFAAISSPEELFLFVSESHPAQQPTEWRRLLDHPLCDQGTALLIVWRNSPVWFYGDEPAGGWNRERYELVRQIGQRYAAGEYPFAVVRFDPADFKGFSFLAGFTPAELDRVPEQMRLPSLGVSIAPLGPADFEWGEDDF